MGRGRGRPPKQQAAQAAAPEELEVDQVPVASWPESLPHPEQDCVLTVSCGNTHYYWASHTGPAQNLDAHLYWRTAALPEREMNAPGVIPGRVLTRYLPEVVQEMLYGQPNLAKPSRATSTKHLATKRIPYVDVYVVSTNQQHLKGLSFLFSELPSRIFEMNGAHFFHPTEHYKGMGVDRLASCRAAKALYGVPSLIIDGGTALTYTGMDATGKIMGGGICTGLGTDFRSLHHATGELPNVPIYDHLDRHCQQSMLPNKKPAAGNPVEKEAAAGQEALLPEPLPYFCEDTQQAMMSSVLRAKQRLVEDVILEFYDHVKKQREEEGDDEKKKPAADKEKEKDKMDVDDDKKEEDNSLLSVIFCGGDGRGLQELLGNQQRIIKCRQQPQLPNDDISTFHHKYLIHQGIVCVLQEECTKVASENTTQKLRFQAVGLRVIKRFDGRPDADGDILYRGTVKAVLLDSEKEGNNEGELDDDLFTIMFDDGDSEDFNIQEFYESLDLYCKHGEKWGRSNGPPLQEKLKAKQEDARKAMNALKEQSPVIQKFLKEEKVRQEKEAEEAKKARDEAAAERQAKKRGAASMEADEPPPQPTKKKRSSSSTPSTANPSSVINCRVAKYFDGPDNTKDLFFGTVREFYPADQVSEATDLWHVVYDDDDEEDYDKAQIDEYLSLYKQNKAQDPNPIK